MAGSSMEQAEGWGEMRLQPWAGPDSALRAMGNQQSSSKLMCLLESSH